MQRSPQHCAGYGTIRGSVAWLGLSLGCWLWLAPGEPVLAQESPDLASGATEVRQPEVTGVIIDAQGLGFQPSMGMRLFDAQGRQIYLTTAARRRLDVDAISTQGTASYAYSLDQARNLNRAGSRPLIVKALGTQGEDLVISQEDAEILQAKNQQDRFLDRMAVVVVWSAPQLSPPLSPELMRQARRDRELIMQTTGNQAPSPQISRSQNTATQATTNQATTNQAATNQAATQTTQPARNLGPAPVQAVQAAAPVPPVPVTIQPADATPWPSGPVAPSTFVREQPIQRPTQAATQTIVRGSRPPGPLPPPATNFPITPLPPAPQSPVPQAPQTPTEFEWVRPSN
ncbi:hypothetical protein [Leptolyngbya sp. FACHB-261]|uniref:hypothetical protein n=1 Tax=Leptolyngbya sp. FACHB-261 TaxID=2692806 RepID=UPI001688D48A|nr:hypothetical protein [Leptolyngbya sp. FACHB-261]MBD2102186.1 hypothetical protein [Leptolyngbya sp. FACHB-261]